MLLITGPPGSGKTALSCVLSTRLGIPVLSRDAIKVRLIDDGKLSSAEVRVRAFDEFYAGINRACDEKTALIAEQALEKGRYESNLQYALEHGNLIQVACCCPVPILAERVRQRGVRPGFLGDVKLIAAMQDATFPVENYQNVELGVPTIQVFTDVSIDCSIDSVLSYLNSLNFTDAWPDCAILPGLDPGALAQSVTKTGPGLNNWRLG